MINLRCKAVVSRNVGSFELDGTCRGNATAFASTRVSNKAIPTASTEMRVEVFLCSRFVSDWGAATRNEDWPDSPTVKQPRGHEEMKGYP